MVSRSQRFHAAASDASGGDTSFSHTPQEGDETSSYDQFSKQAIRKNLTSQGHSEETISEVFTLLQERIPSFIEDIEQAQASGDHSAITSQAHAAKGVLNTIQLPSLAESARTLEYAARSGEKEEVERIGSEFLDSLRTLNQRLNGV